MKLKSGSLYYKLKVLVAKLYKAERLYFSMRTIPERSSNSKNSNSNLSNSNLSNAGAGGTGIKPTNINSINSDRINLENNFRSLKPERSITNESPNRINLSSGLLIEHANEIRATEWYQVHHNFRERLNVLIERGNTPQLPLELNRIWHEFCGEFELAEFHLNEARSGAGNSLEREEYAHLLKISSELIRRKARLQALKVIHDELQVLISPLKTNNSGIEFDIYRDLGTSPDRADSKVSYADSNNGTKSTEIRNTAYSNKLPETEDSLINRDNLIDQHDYSKQKSKYKYSEINNKINNKTGNSSGETKRADSLSTPSNVIPLKRKAAS
ncbi:MAG TPA: hypothetical protein PKA63_06855 [Oligoflexia bacterium]|nr:hypothetical protein [Oligoflexia bacterium]HMP48369.1 hypothetical protein [Oligoflexia bacterium]